MIGCPLLRSSDDIFFSLAGEGHCSLRPSGLTAMEWRPMESVTPVPHETTTALACGHGSIPVKKLLYSWRGIISRSSFCVQEFFSANYSRLHHMMQEFVLLLLLLIWVSWISMLRPGIKPMISFTGVRDYARSAVASWTILICIVVKIARFIVPFARPVLYWPQP